MNGASNKVREQFIKHIFSEISDRATGTCFDRIYDEKPCRKFFVGNLSTQKDLDKLSRVITKTSPFVIGIEVLIRKSDLQTAKIRITPKGAFYYRVFPTLNEQKQIYDKEKSGEYIPALSEEDDKFEGENDEGKSSGYRLRSAYKKIPFKEIIIEKNLKELLKGEFDGEGEFDEIKEIISSALQIFDNDENKFFSRKHKGKTRRERSQELNVPEEVLKDEAAFSDFLKGWGEKSARPKWDVKLKYSISNFNDENVKLSISMINNLKEEREQEGVDNSIFETKIGLKLIDANFEPFVLDYLKDDYKYDGNIFASGINCSIKKNSENEIHTEHLPVFEQKKYKSNSSIKITFKELAENPIPVLKNLQSIMENAIKELEKDFENRKSSNSLTEKGKRTFKDDLDNFRREFERYSTGIKVLEEKNNALEAFILMNKSFLNSSKSFDTWHLFQIVFIVMEVPDIASVHDKSIKNYRDYVDVVYFPTGGGKTEAYLGTVVFTIFYDRLMGKKAGVSAVTRFPLRLLSLQQLQRIADIFAQAEKLRRSHPIIGRPEFEQFSTGYFVGEGNTPNKIYSGKTPYSDKLDKITPIIEGGQEKELFKIIQKCPFCHQNSVEVEGDLKRLRILHVCKNPNCKEELPIYISDEEIFRYLPTFIISTLDKMASIGWMRFYRNIFGQVTLRCPDHGYMSDEECYYKKKKYGFEDPNLCKIEKYEKVQLSDPLPTIFIQDEMHLIKESLGSYDSHYESFLNHYSKTIGEKKIKIITSTATISKYWLQLKELYQREGIQFPSAGPKLMESFYAYEDKNELSRLIVGLMPHNKTIIFTVLDIIRFYSEIIQDYKKDPQKLIDAKIGFKDIKDVVDTIKDYELSLSYNLVKLEGDAVNQSIKTMVNPRLKKDMYKEINYATLTGDVNFSDIKEVLASVENPDSEGKIDLITATSMISHGVDIDKMNFMIFRGMPRNTAEYIQAYSRVGRKYPGLIFIVFNHTRERDQSYYKYFVKFHEFKDMLVEPVPINRWAKFTIHRTLPGIFSAAILNYFDPKLQKKGYKKTYMSKGFSKAYNDKLITDEQIMDFVLQSYNVETDEKGLYFKSVIEQDIKKYINEILFSDSDKFIPMLLSDKPMTSLRDTDIPIEISPTKSSYDPMDSVSSRRTKGVD